MLWRVLKSNDGLPADARVVFANTGKEAPETLAFVRDCGNFWGVPITWLEWQVDGSARVVDFHSASRAGEPFAALIAKRNYLPNPVARFCTVELKILTIERHLRASGWDEWDSMIGVRADEPRRVAKMRANPKGGRGAGSRCLPLADVGVIAADVGAFWREQPFDLALPNISGVTMHGNCDLCFLKGAHQVMSLIAERPSRAVWWAAMESSITNAKIQNGGRFRSDRPSYAAMAGYAQDQVDAFGHADDEAAACYCGE